MIVIIVITCIAGYGFLAGITYAVVSDQGYEDPATLLAAMFWPFGLPLFVGVTVVQRLKARHIPRVIVTREVVRKELPP